MGESWCVLWPKELLVPREEGLLIGWHIDKQTIGILTVIAPNFSIAQVLPLHAAQ